MKVKLLKVVFCVVFTCSAVGKMEYGELEFSERVGGGAFGVVFRGFWNTKKAGKIVVAIKNLMDKEDEKEVLIHQAMY